MDNSELDRAVAILKCGGLVAFPTETVYGLGADARNPQAVRKIYALKGRPAEHPVIVHLADAAQLSLWARDISHTAHKLARTFWPGPLTLILKRAPGVSDAVTGGQDTVGIRVPSHPVARALLAKFGSGIAAPSANRFGRVSATTAQHVKQEFGDRVDLVLDGGASEVGIESTIVDATTETPVLLRPGHITARQIEEVAGTAPAAARADAPRAPGTLAAHYAPHTPLRLTPAALLHDEVATLARQGRRAAVLARTTSAPTPATPHWISSPPDAAGYARDLYASLRRLDAAGCDVIVVEQPPQTPEWVAINDRLTRAAFGSGNLE